MWELSAMALHLIYFHVYYFWLLSSCESYLPSSFNFCAVIAVRFQYIVLMTNVDIDFQKLFDGTTDEDLMCRDGDEGDKRLGGYVDGSSSACWSLITSCCGLHVWMLFFMSEPDCDGLTDHFAAGTVCRDDVEHFIAGLRKITVYCVTIEEAAMSPPVTANQLSDADTPTPAPRFFIVQLLGNCSWVYCDK